MKETRPHHSPESAMPESGGFDKGGGGGRCPTTTKSIHAMHGAKGGRPRVALDRAQVLHLRATGLSWRKVASQLGLGLGTVLRAAAAAQQAVEAGSGARTVPKAIGDAKETML
jgi:hypothetical protein